MPDLETRFAQFENDYGEFEHVKNKLATRRDLHAFILLDRLLPYDCNYAQDIVSAAEHDEYWLGIDCDKLNEVVTDEQIQELVRCGVRYDEYDSLHMFA